MSQYKDKLRIVCRGQTSALIPPICLFMDILQMSLFVSLVDAAGVLRTTAADLRLFRPKIHVVRPRTGNGGRRPDLLALGDLLNWLDGAMGGGLDAEVAADLARHARLDREFDGAEGQR